MADTRPKPNLAGLSFNELKAMRDEFILRSSAPQEPDDDETYEIGKRDGYELAVQEIDQATGGDGEYCYVMGVASDQHCPDAETMKRRIVERFEVAQEPVADDDALTLRDACGKWATFVAAREAMNAARPALEATPAERALYDERYQADYEAEREIFDAALNLFRDGVAQRIADRLQAKAPETERTMEMCDACNGAGVGVADTVCGKCDGAGGYPSAGEQ